MYRKYLNARSPLRLLEKGLHGGLGKGNLGLVLAGPGVGKTSFLVGVALDDLLRGEAVLHVVLDQTVAHTRTYYDTVFSDLAATTHLEGEAQTRAEAEGLRSIRAYPQAGFAAAKLREAAKLEEEAGKKPAVVILEGLDADTLPADEIREFDALASELGAEVWISVACPDEKVTGPPASLDGSADAFDVILALEPGDGVVALRALKDHANPDVSALHVALDPTTMLLKRG